MKKQCTLALYKDRYYVAERNVFPRFLIELELESDEEDSSISTPPASSIRASRASSNRTYDCPSSSFSNQDCCCLIERRSVDNRHSDAMKARRVLHQHFHCSADQAAGDISNKEGIDYSSEDQYEYTVDMITKECDNITSLDKILDIDEDVKFALRHLAKALSKHKFRKSSLVPALMLQIARREQRNKEYELELRGGKGP